MIAMMEFVVVRLSKDIEATVIKLVESCVMEGDDGPRVSIPEKAQCCFS